MKTFKWLVIGLSATLIACGQGNTGSSRDGDDGSDDGDDDRPRDPPPGVDDIDTDTFVPPGARATRRLTAAQFRNTVKIALGLDVPDDLVLPVDRQIGAFAGGEAQASPSQRLATIYATAATRLASLATAPEQRAQLFDDSDCADECLEAFIDEIGRRLFRRPVLAEERGPLADAARLAGDDLFAQAAFALEVMLQSTPFLYVADTGEVAADHEDLLERDAFSLATRLSLLLWNAGPDDELLSAAGDGALFDLAGLRKQVGRMLGHPHARNSQREFLRELFGYDLAPGRSKAEPFRAFTDELARAMVAEVDGMLDRALEDRQPLEALFTLDRSPADDAVKAFYEADAERDDDGWFTLPDSRRGLFGTAAFLAANSGTTKPSPTLRGKLVLEQFLCAEVGTPPPGAPADLPEPDDGELLTVRQRTERYMLAPGSVCRGCHQMMDPIGFLFEEFDVIGKQRGTERIGGEAGTDKPIDASGWLAALDGQEARGVAELGQILADSPDARACLIQQFLRWAFGRADEEGDLPMVESLTKLGQKAPLSLELLFEAVAVNPSFRLSRIE